MSAPIFKKVCLLGDYSVGKTSLVRRVVDNQFSDDYLSTIGVKISRKLVHVPASAADVPVQVVLWDLEGREVFDNAARSYLSGAAGAVIVGDVTRPETLMNLEKHIAAFLSCNPGASVAVAYNKIDLVNEKEFVPTPVRGSVTTTARTSAKSGTGIATLFETLCRNMLG